MTKLISPFRPFLVLFLMLFMLQAAWGQEAFTGQLTYHISYEGSVVDLPEQQQLPSQVVILARGPLVRAEVFTPGINQVKITNAEEKTSVTLLDIGENKYAIEKSGQEIKEQIAQMPEVELVITNERQTILGYECQKVLAITHDAQGNKQVSEIYYTDQLDGTPLHFDTPYHDIPGVMLKYVIRAGNLVMHYEATSVEEKWMVGGSHFRIPDHYEYTTYQELRQRLSGE